MGFPVPRRGAGVVGRRVGKLLTFQGKNLVKAGVADRAEVQLAYAIGVAEPVSIRVDHFGTSKLGADELERLVRKHFDLTPRGIDEALNLRRPIYRPTSYHGHFGRENEGFPWEETDKAAAIAKDL